MSETTIHSGQAWHESISGNLSIVETPIDFEGFSPEDEIRETVGSYLQEKNLDPAKIVFSGHALEADIAEHEHIWAASIVGLRTNDGGLTKAEGEDPISYAVEAWEGHETPAISFYLIDGGIEPLSPMLYDADELVKKQLGVFILEEQ